MIVFFQENYNKNRLLKRSIMLFDVGLLVHRFFRMSLPSVFYKYILMYNCVSFHYCENSIYTFKQGYSLSCMLCFDMCTYSINGESQWMHIYSGNSGKMAFQVFYLLRIQLSSCHCSHIHRVASVQEPLDQKMWLN